MELGREKKKNGSQYDSYSILDKFDFKQYEFLYKFCNKTKIEFQSTPFDLKSLDILQKLSVHTYKIASCDITNFLLLEAVAKTRKPIFLSTGAANLHEIREAVNFISKYNTKIVIMHCILCYPTNLENANLNSITFLKKKFPNIPIGFSDHTLGILAPTIASSLGAMVIEKHFTINKKLKKSADHWLSVDEKELSQIANNINYAKKTWKRKQNCKIESKNAVEILLLITHKKRRNFTQDINNKKTRNRGTC